MRSTGRKIATLTVVLLGLATTGGNFTAKAQEAEAVAPTSLVETYSDWIVRCVATDNTRVCEMTQELRQQDGGQRVLAASLRPGADGSDGANLTVIAPFGLNLSEGLQISITEEANLLSMGFLTCLPVGCVATQEINADQLSALKDGETVSVRMTNTDAQQINVSLSLAGFTDAWNRLSNLL